MGPSPNTCSPTPVTSQYTALAFCSFPRAVWTSMTTFLYGYSAVMSYISPQLTGSPARNPRGSPLLQLVHWRCRLNQHHLQLCDTWLVCSDAKDTGLALGLSFCLCFPNRHYLPSLEANLLFTTEGIFCLFLCPLSRLFHLYVHFFYWNWLFTLHLSPLSHYFHVRLKKLLLLVFQTTAFGFWQHPIHRLDHLDTNLDLLMIVFAFPA